MSEQKADSAGNSNQESSLESILPIGEHEEEVLDESGRNVRHRGVYLLPNLFTTANMFAGFYAIVCSMHDSFMAAAVAIFFAMIFDGLDGRIARITNTQSAFGAEYDSLSDMVAFGVAPALMAYQWALHTLGNVGLSIAFVYMACAALRLARFNTQIGVVDKRWFIGLASPAAAAVVAAMIWSVFSFGEEPVLGEQLPGFAVMLFAFFVAVTGLLMVSNIKFYSFKDFDFRGRVPFVSMLIVVLAFAVIFSDTPRVLLLIFMAYACSGPVQMLLELHKTKKFRPGA